MKLYLYSLTFILMIMISGCATSYYYTLPSAEFEEIDYKFDVKKVEVKNITVAYIDEGQGDDVLLLIHGLGTNAKSWMKNIPALSEKYRVIAVDLPGYGKSEKGNYKYSMSFYAQVLTEMLNVLGIEKATFVGHSMGGQIAMVTALNYPGKVNKLVLIDPAGFERFTEGEGDWMKAAYTIDLVKETTIRNIDVNLKMNFYETPEDASFFVTDRIQIRGAKEFEDYCYAVTRNVTGMIDEPVWAKLDQIKQETLIIFGEEDGLIPNPYLHGGRTEAIAKIGQEEIPNNKLVIIPECGHMAQFEKADVVNKEIIDFMK